jgi:hypothetical protein
MQVGDLVVTPISDGTFIARPAYFGDDATADGHGDLFDRHGQAWLPIGCFLVRSGDRCVLVDAGTSSVPTCTPDHVGWLFDQESRPTFPNATIWFGAGDWRHFIEPRDPLVQHHIHQSAAPRRRGHLPGPARRGDLAFHR